MAQQRIQYTAGARAKTSEESRKDNSSAYSAKGQTTSRSPGDTQARSVQAAVGIAASGIQTMRRTSGFHCCRISSALIGATRVVCVPYVTHRGKSYCEAETLSGARAP
ncbi:hypothetical protein TcCL_NonESM04943 [Trypanosoma cruzi]|nr:hypothetical protein TcCL_NonESM04943 [Trypanosoma cruzi]